MGIKVSNMDIHVYGENWECDSKRVLSGVEESATHLKAWLRKDNLILGRDNQELHKINLLDIRVSEVSRCKTTTSIICMCLHDWHLYSCILSLSMHCMSLSTKNTSNQSRSRNYLLQSFVVVFFFFHFIVCLFVF